MSQSQPTANGSTGLEVPFIRNFRKVQELLIAGDVAYEGATLARSIGKKPAGSLIPRIEFHFSTSQVLIYDAIGEVEYHYSLHLTIGNQL